MEMPETELTATKRPVWNAGRTVGAKRALKPKQIWETRAIRSACAASISCAREGRTSFSPCSACTRWAMCMFPATA